MRSTRRTALLLLLAVILPAALHAQESRIHYTVSLIDPGDDEFVVTAELYDIRPDTLRFFFPAWAPGAYQMANFGAFAHDLRAHGADGTDVTVKRAGTNQYLVIAPPSPLTISYTMDDVGSALPAFFWPGLSSINAGSDFAFANGPALFGYPDGFTEIPCTVTYIPPDDWKVAVPLEEIDTRGSTRTFRAGSYDDLADAPMVMGDFQELTFDVKGIPHTIILTAPIGPEQAEWLTTMIEISVTTISDFFGEIPYERYHFQFFVEGSSLDMNGFLGALEHANSSTYVIPSRPMKALGGWLMSIVMHEYWHLWSPKRFHVRTLGPFDYQHPPATTSLWFHEGLTDYYAHNLMMRNGLASTDWYFRHIIGLLRLLYHDDLASVGTVSSTMAQEGFSHFVYERGAMLSFLIDAEIRVQTDNARSLDDAMRHFNTVYGDHHGGKEFGDEDIIPIIEEATGARLAEFYRRHIVGSEPPAIDYLMFAIGMTGTLSPHIGATFIPVDEGWEVYDLQSHGVVPASGLVAQDTIVALIADDGTVTKIPTLKSVDRLVDLLKEWDGREATIRFIRNGMEMERSLFMHYRISDIKPNPKASEKALAIRRDLFGF